MFAIDRDNNIFYVGAGVSREDATNFSSESALLNIVDSKQWTREDLEAIWNAFAGTPGFDKLRPVKKFRNRPYGVQQIWNAIQHLAPEEQRVVDRSVVKKEKKSKVAKAEKPAKKAKAKNAPKPNRAAKPKTERKKRVKGEGKKDQALQLMLRKSGVTATELSEKLGWNENSITMLAQWVDLVTRNGIKSFEVARNMSGDRVFKAA